MKYSLLLIISLFSLTAFSAKNNVEKVSGNILDLRNNKVVFINGNDTIQSIKKGNIFYFSFSKDIVINKVLLPDTAKVSHSFKVTSNGKLIGEESQDKKSHDQNIQVLLYNVYTLYWGGINWKICYSDEFSRKFDLILLDTKQISIKDNTGDKIEDIDDNGFFELNDTVTINSVQFPAAGHLVVQCNGEILLEKNVRKIEDNFGLTLYEGKSYIFTLGEKSWNIGTKEETNDSINMSSWILGILIGIIISIISWILFRKRELIRRIILRYKSIKLDNGETLHYKSKNGAIKVGTVASPDGFHSFEDGRHVLVEKGYVSLIFPAESNKFEDSNVIIDCKEDGPQCGNIAYPNGDFLLPDGTSIIVNGYRIQEIRNRNEDIKNEEKGNKTIEVDSSQDTEQVQSDWRATLTDSTKAQIVKSLESEVDDFDSYDQLCSTLAMCLIHIKEEWKPSAHRQKTDEDFVRDLINEMMNKKRNIREAFKGKTISNKEELINNVDLLLMKGKPNEVSYTLEKLSGMVERMPLPTIDGDLRDKVLDVYVRRYLNNKFNLDWNEKTILSNAIKGIEVIKSTELEAKALDVIGKIVGVKFHGSIDEFKDVWNDKTTSKTTPNVGTDSELLNRLKLLASSKNQTISEMLEEMEAPSTTSNAAQVDTLINGKSIDKVKQDLEEYERIKILSELTQFGTTPEAIEKEISIRGIRKGQTELANAIKEAVGTAVPNLEVVEPYENLKKMVEGIHKADTAEKLANAIGRVSVLVKDMSSLQEEKERALQEKESALEDKKAADTLITNEVKSHFQNLFKEELPSDDSINAINIFVERVGTAIGNLNNEIDKKNDLIVKKETEIDNQKKELDEKEKEIKTLCEDYSCFIVTAFEQVEKDLVRTCQSARTSDALPAKFIQRVIQNDAFNVSDFMSEMRGIINNSSSDHKDIIKSLHNLFLDTIQSNSWVQTLSHIYLYVQKPEVASYFTKNKIDVGCINASFILTEHMMRALGIELHYPKLFEETFDSNVYDESTLSDVKDYVSDVKELVGDRQGVIIDMFRLGYTSDGETHKAKVTRFN